MWEQFDEIFFVQIVTKNTEWNLYINYSPLQLYGNCKKKYFTHICMI